MRLPRLRPFLTGFLLTGLVVAGFQIGRLWGWW